MILVRYPSLIEEIFVFLRHRHRICIMENKDLNRIKVMIAEKNRTNKWLAEQLGVNAATVSKWCTNSSQLSLDMLSKIAAALKVDYTELVRIKRIHGEEE